MRKIITVSFKFLFGKVSPNVWTHPPTPGFLWDLGKWKVKFGSIPNQYVQVNSGSRLVVGSSLLQVGSAFMISCSEWGRASLAWSHHGFCDQEFWDGYHELLAWSECSPHRAHLDLCSDKVVNRSLLCTFLVFYHTLFINKNYRSKIKKSTKSKELMVIFTKFQSYI